MVENNTKRSTSGLPGKTLSAMLDIGADVKPEGNADLIKTCAEDIGRDTWFKLREHGIIAYMASAEGAKVYDSIEESARILSNVKVGSADYIEAKQVILGYVGKLANNKTSQMIRAMDQGHDVICDVKPHPIQAYQELTQILGPAEAQK
tara:strand:- start:802 stop:1248 length:447 start_codon:yes stop_codon:yes gene_type:complete